MNVPRYGKIVRHYEKRFDEHGATFKGMDWPNAQDLRVRFTVMLGVIRKEHAQSATILDLGCGVGLLVDMMKEVNRFNAAAYRGIDMSGKMIEVAAHRHPDACFEERDILKLPLLPKSVDYVILNGVLTEKVTLSQRAMESYACQLIKAAYDASIRGIAFNVMSSHVDWRRRDLFHWPLDRAVKMLVKECSRHIVARMDYGLYEQTIYVYREPNERN
jgi:SAM-dependent methyltransferase